MPSNKQKIEEEKNNSPEAQICQYQNQISQANQWLAREKKIGEQSGYVNKATLHSQTSIKMFSVAGLKKAKDDYRKKTGKEFDMKKCKLELIEGLE